MSELRITGATVSYGDVVAVRDVDLAVESGEIVAVVGPSGCGKSTLLRAIAGLEPLAAGTITLGGRDLGKVATHERDLGLMFQEHALFPHLSVADNVAFGLRMQKAGKITTVTRVAELLDMVGLRGLGDRQVDELSGGEAQRVALARALAPSPGLLMLDEPLGSLDRLLREQLVGDLAELFKDVGVTALHVTHDQAEAFALADRVVVMNHGEVQQVGAPADLWRSPSSAFVASFLGHPNVWGSAGLVVPTSAIAAELVPRVKSSDIARDGDSIARVERSEFREGRFRVTASSQTPTLCGLSVGPVRVAFDMLSRPSVGDRVQLALDDSQIVRF